MKLYAEDRNLPYKSTTIQAVDSKRDIDAILAHFGITKVMWTWDLDRNDVELVFELSEDFKDVHVTPLIRMKPPTVWRKPRRGKPDEIDWRLSMRIFYWYIKNQLAMTYAMQSTKTVAFLPYIAVSKDATVQDVVIPYLEEIKRFKALPKPSDLQPDEEKAVDAEYEEAM